MIPLDWTFLVPTSIEGINDLVEVGAKYIKNGSDYLGNISLIRDMLTVEYLLSFQQGWHRRRDH